MRNLKKQFFGYSCKEVEQYFTELEKQKKVLIDKKKQAILDEITHLEEMLGKYNQEGLQMVDLFNAEFAASEEIVEQAKERNQVMKREALNNLHTHEEKLEEVQYLLQSVYKKMEEIQETLQSGGKAHRLTLIGKEAK